jgi:hypothetical protein
MRTQAIKQQESVGADHLRNHATRLVATVLGASAGALGLEHGYFETRQGSVVPSGILINAIGSPCQPSQAWHACEPAMTFIPNVLVTGALTIICSLIVLVWALAFMQGQHGGLILLLLAIALTLVGGGFVTLLLGMVAGVAGTKIQAPLTWWRAHLSLTARRVLASLWVWTLVAFLLWFPVEWGIAFLSNDLMLRLGPMMTAILPLLLLVLLVTGFARDLQSRPDLEKTDLPKHAWRIC